MERVARATAARNPAAITNWKRRTYPLLHVVVVIRTSILFFVRSFFFVELFLIPIPL